MKSKLLGFSLILFTVLIFVYFYSLFTLDHIPIAETVEGEEKLRAAYGALGDYYGGLLNPVLGFIGTCLLLLTLHYTRKDLVKTDQALAHQRKEDLINRYNSNIFQLCTTMHTRINLIHNEKWGAYEGRGYNALQRLTLLNQLAKVQQGLHDTDRNSLICFYMDANVWSFIDFALQTLEYFKSILDDNSLENVDKVALINIMDININFNFLGELCITLDEQHKQLQEIDENLTPMNQTKLNKVDSIIDKLLTLENYRTLNK